MTIDTRAFGYEFNKIDRVKEGDDYPPLPQSARSDSGPVTYQRGSQRKTGTLDGDSAKVDKDAIVRRLGLGTHNAKR
jgi:hypothetical protein